MPNIITGDDHYTSRRDAAFEDSLLRKNFNYDYPEGLDLKPGSKLHTRIKNKILERARASQLIMSTRHDSWKNIDWTLTTYIQTDEAEKTLKNMSYKRPTPIVFPYSYAILETLLSYLMMAFFQSPMFRYEGVSPEDTLGAIMLEKIIEFHCVKTKVALALHTMFRDSLAYGFGVSAPGWKVITGKKTVKKDNRIKGLFGKYIGGGFEKVSEDTVIFEGNELLNIDPYLCLPDPNVSIHDQQNGEYFGWVEKTNYFDMLSEETNSEDIFNVKYLNMLKNRTTTVINIDPSEREQKIGGFKNIKNNTISNRVDNINMYIKLIPKEWKLGDSEIPEKWYFKLAADEVIVEARPIGLNHNMFPIAISAPDFDGYSSTPVSRMEILGGMQKNLDWLFNSHTTNVKKSINDMFIIDPYQVNSEDLRNGSAGKLIRLRRPSWGKGVRDVIQQLNVTDVTRGHIQDSAWIVNWMQKIGATDDVSMGSLRQGGPERLTGKEFEGTQRGAFSRLERVARLVGLQAMQDIGYMFASHTKQLMSEELYVKTTGRWQKVLMEEYGDKIVQNKMKVSPFDILVDYDVMVRDGSVPGSNYSSVFMELFNTIAEHPELQRKLDIYRIFKHILRNNGVKNVSEFERIETPNQQGTVLPDEEVAKQVEAGNLVAS